MEISVITPQLSVARTNTQTPAQVLSEPGVAPLIPATQAPSSLVTIHQAVEPSPIYDEPMVVASYLRDNSFTGAAAKTTSQVLMSSLQQLGDKKTTFSVSSLFSQVGALSRETNEYRNEARQFYVPSKVGVDKFTPDFNGVSGTRMESAFLNVKTKDGDVITIQLGRNMLPGGISKLEFSFVVDGELSEKEQKALAQLADKLGAMGDEFFRMDTTELRGLKDVDTSVISAFSFTLQRPDPATDSYVEHTYEFSIDEATQTQHLVAEDVHGYSVDIKSQLQSLAKNNDLDIALCQQYIDLINKATDDSDTPNASKRFMLDAFESLFSGFFTAPNTLVEAETGSAVNAEQSKRAEHALAAFDSGMPDFKASFRSPVVHNPGFYTQVSSMVLTLEQNTQVEQNGNNLLVKQETHYDFINNHFEDFPSEYLDDIGGNYTYTTEHEQATSSRLLSMTNERVNNVWMEQEASKEKQINHFVNYKLDHQENYETNDRRVQEFAELLQKYNANQQQSAVEELLEITKERLFLDI
jgi:hypothetical protein